MANDDFTEIGKRLPRKEDFRFLTGTGRYLDDLEVGKALHACFVRSPFAHARIKSINLDAARAMPGIASIVTGKDVDQWTTPYRMAPPIDGLVPTQFTTLPVDKVRFQGDPVACILATDRYLAEDAMEKVEVDYEPITAVTSYAEAVAPEAPLVDESLKSNLVSHQAFASGDLSPYFAKAHAIVEASFNQGRLTHVPIETRGCVALWDEGRQHLTLHIGNQAPHPLRTALAARLGLSESQVTIICPDVGGGFGQKIALYREELTVAALARALKRPVRWREDRLENLTASSHAREDLCKTRAAVDKDGRVLALELEICEDFGAYCFYPANYLARVVAMILTSPYRIENYAFDVKVALTNKCGNGPMRAPMAITSWVMDGTLDAIARQLGLDPLGVRRINILRPDELPYRSATDQLLEDITPSETLEKVVQAIDYDGFRKRQALDRAKGIYRGLGLCVVVESTTYGSAFYKAAGIAGSGHEAAWVRIEPSGAVNASVGLMGTGQGYETSLSQAVAEGLGVRSEDVDIKLGHTDIAPYGMGSRGGRGGTAGGGVLYLAAKALGAKVLTIAATLLGLNASDTLRLREARVERQIDGQWQKTELSLSDVARIAYLDPLRLPAGMEPGLELHKAYDPPPMTYSNATHACEILLNPKTGRVTIERYVVAEDCGTVLSPVVVEGQQHGAIAMGISGALLEEVRYDAMGQNLSASFADYHIATAVEIPAIELIAMHTPNSRTPAGVKGMAEGGVMGAVGAVSNAVNDALMPFGVVAEQHPLNPERIRSLVRLAGSPTRT